MRLMVIVRATEDSEAGKLPSTELLAEMGKYRLMARIERGASR